MKIRKSYLSFMFCSFVGFSSSVIATIGDEERTPLFLELQSDDDWENPRILRESICSKITKKLRQGLKKVIRCTSDYKCLIDLAIIVPSSYQFLILQDFDAARAERICDFNLSCLSHVATMEDMKKVANYANSIVLGASIIACSTDCLVKLISTHCEEGFLGPIKLLKNASHSASAVSLIAACIDSRLLLTASTSEESLIGKPFDIALVFVTLVIAADIIANIPALEHCTNLEL